MNIKIFASIEEIKKYFSFVKKGLILGEDVYEHLNYTDDNERRIRDAEVLTTIMHNLQGDALEIGTSVGYGTYKLATNTNGTVYTLNAIEEETTGKFITIKYQKEAIGSFLREKKTTNYKQFYADSMKWEMPECIKDLSVVFVDGCHDTEYVYNDSKKTFPLIKRGGFILWHDFSPKFRNEKKKFYWLKYSMLGVEKFCKEQKIKEIFHLKDSLIGFYRKI